MVEGWEYLGLPVRLQPHARSGYWLAPNCCHGELRSNSTMDHHYQQCGGHVCLGPSHTHPRCEVRVSDEKRPILMLGLDGDGEGAQVK